MYTREEVIAEMKKRQGDMQDQVFATSLGISPSYLSNIYRGKSDPGELVLVALGLTKRIFYEKTA